MCCVVTGFARCTITMDQILRKLIIDLKTAQDDFRQSDKAFATATFCEKAYKLLDEVVQDTAKEEFDNQVMTIWIIVSSLNDLLPQLIDCPLLEKLFSLISLSSHV